MQWLNGSSLGARSDIVYNFIKRDKKEQFFFWQLFMKNKLTFD